MPCSVKLCAIAREDNPDSDSKIGRSIASRDLDRRPELKAALKAAKKAGCEIVVAKRSRCGHGLSLRLTTQPNTTLLGSLKAGAGALAVLFAAPCSASAA